MLLVYDNPQNELNMNIRPRRNIIFILLLLATSLFAQDKGLIKKEEQFKLNKKQKAVVQALKKQNLPALKKIVESGFDINSVENPERGTTFMGRALWGPSVEIVKYLKSKGGNVFVGNKANNSSLCLFSTSINKIYERKRKIINYIFSLKPKVNKYFCYDNKYTPLHIASEYCNLPLVEYLLKSGADPNIQDRSKGKNSIGLLVDRYYSKNLNKREERRRQRCLKTANVLIKSGSNPYLRDRGGYNPGVESAVSLAKERKYKELLKILETFN
jgi:ankyrin repeat protein